MSLREIAAYRHTLPTNQSLARTHTLAQYNSHNSYVVGEECFALAFILLGTFNARLRNINKDLLSVPAQKHTNTHTQKSVTRVSPSPRVCTLLVSSVFFSSFHTEHSIDIFIITTLLHPHTRRGSIGLFAFILGKNCTSKVYSSAGVQR